jgi:hypothetical protein
MDDYDIEFEGKKYKKQDFCYYPSKEPRKLMRYCSAFYTLFKKEKAKLLGKSETEITSHELYEDFVSKFTKLDIERKKEGRPITWSDITSLL